MVLGSLLLYHNRDGGVGGQACSDVWEFRYIDGVGDGDDQLPVQPEPKHNLGLYFLYLTNVCDHFRLITDIAAIIIVIFTVVVVVIIITCVGVGVGVVGDVCSTTIARCVGVGAVIMVGVRVRVGVGIVCGIRGLVCATCISVTGIRANIIVTDVICRTILLCIVPYCIIVSPITVIAYITIIGCIDRRWSAITIIH